MVEGLDALIIALAPVFAAGFAVQKLLEIFDALFSWVAHILANGAEGLPGAEEKKVSKGKGANTNNNTLANGPKSIKDIPANGLKSISGKINDAKKAQVTGINANASPDDNGLCHMVHLCQIICAHL